MWPRRGPLTALVLNREQTDLALLAIDPATGSTKQLLAEHDDAWLNVNVGAPKWLEDGSGFLWMTEAKGAWTLELHDQNGALVRQLTTPDQGLRALAGIANNAAIVQSSTEAPATSGSAPRSPTARSRGGRCIGSCIHLDGAAMWRSNDPGKALSYFNGSVGASTIDNE